MSDREKVMAQINHMRRAKHYMTLVRDWWVKNVGDDNPMATLYNGIIELIETAEESMLSAYEKAIK